MKDLPRKLSKQDKIEETPTPERKLIDSTLVAAGKQVFTTEDGDQQTEPTTTTTEHNKTGNGTAAAADGGCHGKSVEKRNPPKQMSTMEHESLLEREHISQIRLCSAIIYTDSKYTRETFRRLFLSKELLEHLFKLFDQDRDGKLVQEEWIEFLKARLTKELDFVEQIESVAYCICGEGPIELDQFFRIFYTKGIVDKIFKIIDKDNVGSITSEQIMDFLASITTSRPRTGFDKNSLEQLEKVFRDTVGDEKEIKREDFKKIVISKNTFFTERVFQIFDKDNSGSISLQEFFDTVHQFAGKSPEDKIKFLFRVYDLDGDGLIQRKELQDVMRACMEENGMQFGDEEINDLTAAMFEDADTDNRGAITYEALKNQLAKHEGLLENLSISIDRWLVPPKPKPPATVKERIQRWIPYQLTKPYFKNNYVYLIFLGCYIFVNLALFISRAIQYANMNAHICVVFARACGQCLNFNCTFIVVLMLRYCITFLRTRGVGAFLPLDHHIYFHKLTGTMICFYSTLHTVMHFWYLPTGVRDTNRNLTYTNCTGDYHFNSKTPVNCTNLYTVGGFFVSKFGLIDGAAYTTGVILMLILIVIYVCSQPCVRRGGCFEIFYWTHLLYVPFWVLLILHCENFWKWFLVPGAVYALERAYRFVLMKSEMGETYITSAIVLHEVVHLSIKRPSHFDFHPGDYVFVNIPTIAKYEWHPFTISSAPETKDHIWLHIRAIGQWTNRLYEYFKREEDKLKNSNEKKSPSTASLEVEYQNPIKKIQATITRTFSNKEKAKPVQLIGYSHENLALEPKNKSDGNLSSEASCSVDLANYSDRSNATAGGTPLKFPRLFDNKVPLEKSLSMPDMQTRMKNRERLLFLKDHMRSESEKSFDECQMKRAKLRTLGLTYTNLQNKPLAQSFRYMRNKPTIIAFKTPSLENCEKKGSATSLVVAKCQEKQLEEGEMYKEIAQSNLKPIDYPTGKPLEIRLDGPYGTPSSHIFRAQHAVLIATGIGVTPFASILRSIMIRYHEARQQCPKCNHCFNSEVPQSVMNLKQVDFFWINRTQKHFEWFISLLSELEIGQAELSGDMERFLNMHMYITSALQKTDMKAVGLQLALDLLHEKGKRDLITGLKTRTNAGRPNWDKIFNQLSSQKKGKVTVFFCGKPALARELRKKCDIYGFSFRKEMF